MSRWWR